MLTTLKLTAALTLTALCGVATWQHPTFCFLSTWAAYYGVRKILG